MLDMGFIDDVDYIMRKLPNGSQTALFSATMPNEIVRLADRYMNHPVNVLIDSDELSLDEIDQSYAIVDERSKFQALVEYVRKNKISSGIIFCATKIKTQRLAERLQAQGFRAAPIHGESLPEQTGTRDAELSQRSHRDPGRDRRCSSRNRRPRSWSRDKLRCPTGSSYLLPQDWQDCKSR